MTLGHKGELLTLGTRGDCWSSTYCATAFSIASFVLRSPPPEIGGSAGGVLGVEMGAEVPEVLELAHPESETPTMAAKSPRIGPSRPLNPTVKIMPQDRSTMPATEARAGWQRGRRGDRYSGAIGRVMTATSKRRIAYLCRGSQALEPGDTARSRE